MKAQFQKHIEEHLPFLKNGKSLIAISGGVDSVVLTHLCHDLKLNFSLAHCNFNLRGEESKADEEFVMELGEQLDVEVFIQNFDTKAYSESHKTSIQMAARELRYHWLADLAEQLDYNFILTAHHADDNLETFIINFTRGTGLNGLKGIPEVNENIVRPLLPFSREAIKTYAKSNNLNWREDSSNSSRKYLRNKLRHEVVPILKEINPQLLDSFKKTLGNLNDTADIIEESLNAVAKRAIVSIDETGITYKVSEFKKVNNPKAYLFEMFKDFGFMEWNDVVGLLDAETGKYVTSQTHKLIKHREFLILSELQVVSDNEVISIDTNIKTVETSLGILRFAEANTLKDNSDAIIFVDADKLIYPLELRIWKTGDYFRPLGMNGKKKVSKFIKDEKMTPIEKQNTWVLVSNGNIVWVIGKRADDRYKVTDHTRTILKIEWQ